MAMHSNIFMTRKTTLLLGLMAIVFTSFAQIPEDFEYNHYKELYPKESFVYLKSINEKVIDLEDDELSIHTNYEERVLCLNKNAFNISKRSIGYSDFSTIEEIKATAYIPNGNKYKKNKVKSFNDKEVITNGTSFYSGAREKEFVFEDLKEGAVTEIQVKRIIKDPHLLSSHSFSRELPIKEEIFRIKAAKGVELGYYERNMDKDLIAFKQYEEGDYQVYEWVMKNTSNLETYGQERYSLYYEPHVIPYIKSYPQADSTVHLMSNLSDLYKWYASLVSQVDVEANDEMKELAKSLTEGLETEEEKVKKIYEWVQANIKYIAFGDGYGGFVPRDPKLVYKRRFGDCKDMTSIIISMLRSLDIQAYFTWVGTRSMPYRYTEIATPSVDNHMIATYFSKDSTYFLDATDSDLKFGRGGYNTQGKQVLIGMNSKEYKIDSVPVLLPTDNAEIDTAYLKIEDQKIVGKANLTLSGYLAAEVYASYKDRDEERKKDLIKYSFQKGSNKYNLLDYTLAYDESTKDIIELDYEFEIESYVKQFDDKTYLNLNLTKQLKDYAINKSQNVPMFFDYPNMVNKHYVLELGDQFELINIPENQSVSNDLLHYEITYKQEGDKLHYNLLFEQKTLHLETSQFESWNSSINQLSKALNETITLKNKNLE